MLETIVQKYENIKTDYKKEKAMRQLARAIEGSPIESTQTNIPYKAMAMFLMPAIAITASCATTAQETKKPETQKQTSEWSKPAPRPIRTYGTFGQPGLSMGFHDGIDWDLGIGTPIIAAANGIISYSGYLQRAGETIGIYHGYGKNSRYSHLDKRLAEKDRIVFAGQQIATSGHTGEYSKSTNLPPHLHFGLHDGGGAETFSVDPMPYFAGGKPYTYDGVTDYGKIAREKGTLLLSAPFAGPVPRGNVKLEQIVKSADVTDERVKEFLKNPEQYKKELFESSMALIAKKSRLLAEDLAGLPILNDGVDAKEALSVWKLYDALKDEVFPEGFGLSGVIADSRIAREIYVLWGSKEQRSLDVRFKWGGRPTQFDSISVSPYQIEPDDSFYVPEGYDAGLLSNVGPGDKDGFLVSFFGLPWYAFTVSFAGKDYIVRVSELKHGSPMILNDSLEAGLLEKPKRDEVYSAIGILEDMIIFSREHKKKVGSKVYQWNFWLQELVRYGQEKDLTQAFRAYSGLDNFVTKILWKP